MASVVKGENLDKSAETDAPAPSAAPGKQPPARRPAVTTSAPAFGGFFSIYKRSQGYWTRMGTAITAGVIGAFIAYNIYNYVPTFLNSGDVTPAAQTLHQHIAVGAALGFLVVYALIAWYVMNKPKNVEFLIATDVEMKKVNWTSKRELLGSTKVVVAFMFLLAIFLFAVDEVFRLLMQFIHVLNWGAPF